MPKRIKEGAVAAVQDEGRAPAEAKLRKREHTLKGVRAACTISGNRAKIVCGLPTADGRRTFEQNDGFARATGSNIELNSNVFWSVGTDADHDNIRVTAIHELRHGADLLHADIAAHSIMPTAYDYDHWEDLHADDEQI